MNAPTTAAVAADLWRKAYNRFRDEDARLLHDFEAVIQRNSAPGSKEIKLGTERSQRQLTEFINDKVKLSQQRSGGTRAAQTVKAIAKTRDLALTASAASPPVNAALAGVFLAFSMTEMYSSEMKARNDTACRLAKVLIRRKVACGRVSSQSPHEPEELRDLRWSLHVSYLDLYHAILQATAKLVCSLDDSSWDARFIRRMKMSFGWTEWDTIYRELKELEDDIKDDEDEIVRFGNFGPAMPASSTPVAQPAPAPPPPPPCTATAVRQSRNALHGAAVNNDLAKVIELVASKKFDINAKTRRSWTALILAAERGFVEVTKILLDVPGIAVDAENDKGNTALQETAASDKVPEKKRVAVIKLLLAKGARVDHRNHAKRTAFLDAAKAGNLKIVQVLLQNKAHINQVTGGNGWSALHESAFRGHFEVVKFLLSKKIDANIKPTSGFNQGKTAAQIARRKGLDEIATYIEEHSAGKTTK